MTTDTTWDGTPIAAGAPRGSTIVARRRTQTGWQYPILHRAANGTGYEGHWAWTPPSGMRQPGEGAHTAALRELAEETGITGIDIHPVDLARGHALWTATLADHHTITLDHEHDRFEWLDAEAAAKRCRPGVVGDAITTVEAIPDPEITFRPVTPHDNMIIVDNDCHGSARHWPITADPALHETIGHSTAVVIDYQVTETAIQHRVNQAALIWRFLAQTVLPAHPQAETVWAAVDPLDTDAARQYTKAGFTTDAVLDITPDRRAKIFGLRLAQWL
ncbi:MAG: NUDIX domain-containing protein [Stackebrandtia sp.]